MVNKTILIVNGMARAGKDTFAEYLGYLVPVYKYSSIDKVKEIARHCGWKGGKDEKDRKFLSDLKVLTTEYCDMPFNDISCHVDCFLTQDTKNEVMLIDIREPAEIERAKLEFSAKTVLIVNDRVKNITSNMADAGVFDYTYDYIVENNGTFEEFMSNVEKFAEEMFGV